ncbi:FecCD family ABC transporter permease [Brevibacillus marinus]|uniref:FecCD family ABC transporter permease n=1 Tax=Brevibacillus marinus TaxID=2496837 RepID=UPI001F49B402|nr:iron ABC transporter permease [Brevibacillus marinus]
MKREIAKGHITLRSSSWPFSLLIERRVVAVTIGLTILLLVLFFLSAGMGEIFLNPLEVLAVLAGSGEESVSVIVTTFRLPRILVAMLVGAALAVSGAILQGMIRNPYVSPDIIGFTGGASAAACAFIYWFSGVLSIHLLPIFAFAGAGLTAFVIYTLAWRKGVTPIRLVLIGIGISEGLRAVTMLFVVLSPIYAASQAYIWLTGTVYATTWENVAVLLPWVLLGITAACLSVRSMNVQQLGDELAAGLGSPVQRQRLLLLIISVVLAGAAVSIAGAVGFVGLIAPHIARKLVGPSFGGVLPVAALTGAVIVALADLVARTAFAPLDIPVGVFTAAVGAPFFIYLLYRTRKQ